ncbi:MAG TPA: hypothetical protein VKB53_00740 [Gammaproteobacteria bacterium]|nr:hypothetical protein [Gammaproteobacteria bacterium]
MTEQNINLPHVCYQLTLGVLKTCDTCWVRVNGKLVRGCELQTFDGLNNEHARASCHCRAPRGYRLYPR